jgi:hypothetical protein
MNVPDGDARRVAIQLVVDLIRLVQRNYFDDVPFPEAVCATIFSGQIIAAEIAGKPISEQRLARLVEMPRATLHRRLDYLIDKGFVTRERDGLHFDKTRLKPDVIRTAARTIIETADALRMLDI